MVVKIFISVERKKIDSEYEGRVLRGRRGKKWRKLKKMKGNTLPNPNRNSKITIMKYAGYVEQV
jgi:hypothetical protein